MSVFFLFLAYLPPHADLLLAFSEEPAVPAAEGLAQGRVEERATWRASRASLPGRRIQSYQQDQGGKQQRAPLIPQQPTFK